MRKKFRILSLISCAVLLILAMALGSACSGSNQDAAYYLSCESNSWQTYESESSVPENLLFTKDGDLYKLEIDLEEGDQFTINKIGSSDTIGYSTLFSALTKLVSGDNGSIKVAESGTYAFTLSLSDGTLTYKFTAQSSQETPSGYVSITYSVSQMYVGDCYTFTAVYYNSDGESSGENITWSSDNTSVATVSEGGIVTAVAAGNAKITASYGEYSASVDVTVSVATIPVTGVTLNETELALEIEETSTLIATIAPVDADNQTVFWSSSDSDVATVENGVVTAVGYGTATITVTTANGGFSASCKVTVVRHVDSIKVSSESITLVAGGNTKTLTVTFKPSSATYQNFTYEITAGSDKISVEQTDGLLKITGTAEGKATIVVTSTDNTSAKATCEVEVLASGTILADMASAMQITLNEQASLEVTLENAEIASVAWSVDNDVVSLSYSGTTATVTGNIFGTAVVTAKITSADGNTYTKQCSVLVADEFYFIYGVGLGEYNWDYADYISDENAAKSAGLLLEEVSTGIYQITRSFDPSIGFQIIFPNVASFTDADGEWNMDIKDTATYYDADSSDDEYISNKTDQFMVNTAGVYTITLDLTGSVARVYINIVSVDVTNAMIEIESGNATLKNTNTTVLGVTVTPSGATISEDTFNVWLTSDYEDFETYSSLSYDFDEMTITVNCIKNPKQQFTVTVHCEVGGFETTIDLVFLPASSSVVAVSEISFDEDAYYINVNNGGSAWMATVSAHVNSDATSQGIIYTSADSAVTVNANTGEVTASAFGTFTITATAVGDSSVTATVELTVYSDSFYVIGYVYDTLEWDNPDALSQYTTTVANTLFEDYVFTDSGDHKTFTLEVKFNSSDYFQIVYLGMDDNWTNALTAEFFNSLKSDYSSAYETYNVQIISTGIYTITIDLSGTSPLFTIKYKEAILTDITLSLDDGQSAAVGSGDTFNVSVTLNPTSVYPEESEIVWSVTAGYENYVTINFDYDVMTANVTVSGGGNKNLSFYITCSIRGVDGMLELVLLADGEDEVLPTTIAFDQSEYYFNVNNGGADWEVLVHAAVNSDATIQQVKYSVSSNRVSVNADTGLVTGRLLGTYTIKATAAGNKNVTATCTVTFYSDTFYLIGEYSGEYGSVASYTAVSRSSTTTQGTLFEDYTFTMNSYTSYTLEIQLNRYTYLIDSGTRRYEYGFQIAFLGMNSSFTGALTLSNLSYAKSYNNSKYILANVSNARILVATTYVIEIDLSGVSPVWTINCKDTELTEIFLDTDFTELYNGDAAIISLSYGPSFTSANEGDISWSLSDGASNYVSIAFDYSTLTLNLSVTNVEFTDDITVTLTCTVGELTDSIEFTIKALHRLYYVYDDTEHWLVCSDDDCTYESEHETHTQGDDWTADANGHWHECTVCGGNHVDYASHYTLTEDGWYEGDGICDICGFSLFDIDDDGTLTAYYGEIEQLVIPSEINGITVTALGANLFNGNTYLKEVVIPDSITSVSSYVFANCTSLVSVTLSTNMTSIGVRMFYNCSTLASITLHEGITSLGSSAFYGCTSLKKIELPNSLTSLGANVFAYISAEITWGDNPVITAINGSSFQYWLGTSIEIPSTITSIGTSAFVSCVNLVSISIPDNTKTVTLSTGIFAGCTSLQYAVFGTGVKTLNSGMFTNCTSLEYVVFKDTAFWGWSANCFSGCINLKAVFYASDISKFSEYNWLIRGDADLELLKGLCYAYYESNPGTDVDFDQWTDYFAGTWHYDEDGNIVIWENGTKFTIVIS